jgi:uncharacterized damage-inducible protein DinB
MAHELTTSPLADAVALFRTYKSLADRSLAQVTDADFDKITNDGSNSISIVVKHVGGNLKSRWTDFLTSDGEKPWRNRDGEFEGSNERASVMQLWDEGWAALFDTLSKLSDSDFPRTVMIRNEPHSVLQAITRAVTHTAYHVGQIALLAKHFQGTNFQTLTIPKKKSQAVV